MVWVGMDFEDHRVLAPLPWGTVDLPVDQVSQRPIQPGLEHFQEGPSAASLGSLFKHFTTLIVKNFFLISRSTIFQSKATTPCPVPICPCKKSLSSFLIGPLQVLEDCFSLNMEAG